MATPVVEQSPRIPAPILELPRPPADHPVYEKNDRQRLIEGCMDISRYIPVEQPFWAVTDNGSDSLLVNRTLPETDVRLQIGPIGAFPAEEIAAATRELLHAYMTGGTMGDGFPVEDPHAVRELAAGMMGGFTRDRLVVLFRHDTPEGGFAPVGSVQAQFGSGETKFSKFSSHNFDGSTSMSTYWAVRFKDGLPEGAREMIREIGDPCESELVSLLRIYRYSGERLKALGTSPGSEFGVLAMSALGVGIRRQALVMHEKTGQRVPVACLYDTHHEGLQEGMAKTFGMRILGKPGDHVNTPEVQKTIHRYHYGENAAGGHLNSLVTGWVTIDDYAAKGDTYLNSRGIRI